MYLTADSPKTITLLEKGKVYILGGLVDRNAHKGLCFKKATVSKAVICTEQNDTEHGARPRIQAWYSEVLRYYSSCRGEGCGWH